MSKCNQRRVAPRHKARTIKVYEGAAVKGLFCTYYPQIRLMGRWLADCGFAPGQQIKVIPGAQQIMIQLIGSPAPAPEVVPITLSVAEAGSLLPVPGSRPVSRSAKLPAPGFELNAFSPKLNYSEQKAKHNSAFRWWRVPFR